MNKKKSTIVAYLKKPKKTIRIDSSKIKKTRVRKVKLDEAYYREAFITADNCMQIINVTLEEHPVIMQTPELKKKVEHIQALLYDVYNYTGSKAKI